MGALELGMASPIVARIELALAAREVGNSIDLNQLILALNPAEDQCRTADILTGLTHFSATLSSPSQSLARATGLRSLFKAAINMDFMSVLVATLKKDRGCRAQVRSPRQSMTSSVKPIVQASSDESPSSQITAVVPELVASYSTFVRNTASADSAFVEDLLTAFARIHFRLPLPAFQPVLDSVHDVVQEILDTYPHAEAMLSRISVDRYPHPVRPTEEHRLYSRAMLTIVSYAPSHSLASSLISVVVEKATVVDAMVPMDVWGAKHPLAPLRQQQSPSAIALGAGLASKSLGGSPETPSELTSTEGGPDSGTPEKDSSSALLLAPEAEKMDAILVEFFDYVSTSLVVAPENIRRRRMSSIVHAIERFALPAQGARHVPFLLLYSAASVGVSSVLCVAERFRVSFFNPALSARIRILYLYFSASLLSRCASVSAASVIGWVTKMTDWLHGYIDDHVDELLSVDVKHELFMAGFFAVASIVSLRHDVFDPRVGGDASIANRLRFLRLVSSELNPLLQMPPSLVTLFSRVVEKLGGMNFEDVLEENAMKTLPLTSRSVVHQMLLPLEACFLPRTKERIEQVYRRRQPLQSRRGRSSICLAHEATSSVKRVHPAVSFPLVGTDTAGSCKRRRL